MRPRCGASPTRLWLPRGPTVGSPRPPRAPAQVLRLSVAYAVLDNSEVITRDHLAAALAMWDYAEASAKVLFAEVGYEARQADTNKVRACLVKHGEVTRNQLNELAFSKHSTAHDMDRILFPLIGSGEVTQKTVRTGGRPKTTYSLRNMRDRRDKGVTTSDGKDILRLSRDGAGKVLEDSPEVSGHSPHIPHIPRGGA
jgi:hypothetical protein